MLKRFKRRVTGTFGVARIADARLQFESMGRLPPDAAAGPSEHDPAPEYIAEAGKPAEDVWEREEARYRAKNGPGPST
ncbi:MAG TPA: hypothetical protein VG405_01225 [Solirubrobacteraceae bacterium]|jgi:hypothetical protein|nr:hypothetical protein [Solirubrobacteraceae bacterium]